MKPFTTAATALLAIVALAHLFRLIHPFSVVIAGCLMPQWVSIAGFLVAGGLALMMRREARG